MVPAGLPRPLHERTHRPRRLGAVAADPLRRPQHQLCAPGAGAALGGELAGHRRPGPRRARAGDLRPAPVDPLRPRPDPGLVVAGNLRRRGAGLLRRLDRPVRPALHRGLVGSADALPADHPRQPGAARGRLAAGDHAAVLLDQPGRRGSRRVPSRSSPGVRQGGADPRPRRRRGDVPAHPAQRHGCDPDLPAVPALWRGDHPDRPGLPRFRPAARLAEPWRTGRAGP